jgi:branched-chain amino acid transport system substrate-binding protein
MCCKSRLLRWCFEKSLNVLILGEIIMVIYATFGSKGRVLRVSLAALVAGALMLSFSARVWAGGDTLQLAFIGPLSGKDSDAGRAMLDGVNLYVAEINRRGGVDGRKLEVLAYDDQNNKDIARERAREVARDSNALVVIGHYYSSISLEGGKIYKQYGIPAITASATAPEVTEGNEWYFRVVPDTNFQGRFSAIYTHRILKQDTVNIVFERDAYGSALQRSFASTARNLGIRIKNVWGIKSESDDVDQVLKMITRALQRDPRPGALFVGLQDHEAAKLVRLIRDAGVDLTVVGGDALGSENFPRRFKDISLGKRNPGHYTDGIYATTFFIRDIGNFKAQQFNHAFKRRFGREPDELAATSYDAAAIAVEAIERAKLGGDPAQSRERIRSQLTTFSDIETAYKGVTGRIYFDEHGNAMKPFPFGVYLQSKLISAPVQLKPIVNPEAIVDLHEDLEKGNILAIDDHFMYKTTVIYTGIDINEISNIDPRNGTFSADFYLWLRHSGSLDYSKIEFLNAAEDIHLNDAIMEMGIDPISYSAYRIKGDFQEAFTFRDYPFDSHTLSIRFRHKRLNSNRLLFVADDIGMQRDGGKAPLDRFIDHSPLDTEENWNLKNVLIFSDIGTTDSTLGNPRMFHPTADTDISYSRFNVVTEIERNAKSYVLKNLIPLLVVIMLGYVMLYVTPKGPPFVARMNLGVTALLTAVFLSMEAANQLPNIGYLVALDYLYFATYALILSGIVISVAELIAILRSKDILAKRLELFGRVFQPFFFLTAIGIFVYLYA